MRRTGQDKNQIYNAGRRYMAGTLGISWRISSCGWSLEEGGRLLTDFAKISVGVDGGETLNSEGRRAAFRQFLILGASCRLPSVFWREGTGW